MKDKLREGTVVYFQCNDWNPYPEVASRFIYEFLEGEHWKTETSTVDEYVDKAIEWINENDLCINMDVYDMSAQYWVTTTKEWLTENFPELLDYAKEVPEDDSYVDDRRFFLKYIPENCDGFS